MDIERARDRARHQHQEQQAQEVQKVAQKPRNVFAALAEDSDDEPEVQVQVVQLQEPKQEIDDFPALMRNTKVVQNNNVKSYSCVAATPADEKRLELLRQQRVEATQKKAVTWADADEESDSENEEEEVVVTVTSNYVQPFAALSCTYTPRATSDDDDW
jgi:thioredoxin reductase